MTAFSWVVAKARDAHGRTDAATGAVAFGDDLKGEARANAVMKAETKAKRRVTLSLAGLGFVDESEVGSIPSAQIVNVDTETGELPGPAIEAPLYPPDGTCGQARVRTHTKLKGRLLLGAYVGGRAGRAPG